MSKWKLTCYQRSDGISLRDWCKENGYSYFTLRKWVLKGLSVDEACNVAAKNKKQSLRSYCIENNLNYNTIYNRVVVHGMSREEAAKSKPYSIKLRKRGFGYEK